LIAPKTVSMGGPCMIWLLLFPMIYLAGGVGR